MTPGVGRVEVWDDRGRRYQVAPIHGAARPGWSETSLEVVAADRSRGPGARRAAGRPARRGRAAPRPRAARRALRLRGRAAAAVVSAAPLPGATLGRPPDLRRGRERGGHDRGRPRGPGRGGHRGPGAGGGRRLARRHGRTSPRASPPATRAWACCAGRDKEGIGPAYRAGFRRALDAGAGRVVEMDCDFSHDPARLPALVAAAADADVVLGSRYVPGGGVARWGPLRRAISRGGLLVRPARAAAWRCAT